jgi:glyoxylase-like metal-dependent hydrolase (beta-lactamase superfamily II)
MRFINHFRQYRKNTMVYTISEGVYRVLVNMPRNPLKYLNVYVFRSRGEHIVIDTGLNREECEHDFRQGLGELGIDPDTAHIVLTHMHSDHSGLAPSLHRRGATVYASPADAAILNSTIDWDDVFQTAFVNGVPKNDLHRTRDQHPGYKYRPRGTIDFRLLHEGEELRVGDFRFECLMVPGHSPGHLCLYEPERKLLVIGDHVMLEVTPIIAQWTEDWDPLGAYLASLDKAGSLDAELLLPGHRKLITDFRPRIREIKEHHRHRLEQILSAIDSEPRTAYDIASRVSWDLDCKRWEDFPLAQKWFATSEVLAHLTYLRNRGLAVPVPGGPHRLYASTGRRLGPLQ